MTMIAAASVDGADAHVEALRTEFGAILAERMLEAEALDFLWEARVKARYLGQHVASILDEGCAGDELSRLAVLGFLAGKWQVGLCLVDGDGCPVDLIWTRSFESQAAAEYAFCRAR